MLYIRPQDLGSPSKRPVNARLAGTDYPKSLAYMSPQGVHEDIMVSDPATGEMFSHVPMEDEHQHSLGQVIEALRARLMGTGPIPHSIRQRALIKQIMEKAQNDPELLGALVRAGYTPADIGLVMNKKAFPYINNTEDVGSLSIMTHRPDIAKTHQDFIAEAALGGTPMEDIRGLRDYPALRKQLLQAMAKGRTYDPLAERRFNEAGVQLPERDVRGNVRERMKEVALPDRYNGGIATVEHLIPESARPLSKLGTQGKLLTLHDKRLEAKLKELNDAGLIRYRPGSNRVEVSHNIDPTTLAYLQRLLVEAANHNVYTPDAWVPMMNR